MSESRGDTISTICWRWMAGSWKQTLFPLPVAQNTHVSSPRSAEWITSSWPGLKLCSFIRARRVSMGVVVAVEGSSLPQHSPAPEGLSELASACVGDIDVIGLIQHGYALRD
eukprot:2653281-Rhodomonas_salina.2